MDMFLIFTLRREDIMPAGDLGVRKGVKILYSLSEMPSGKNSDDIATEIKAEKFYIIPLPIFRISSEMMVGPAGFEPATSSTPG